MLHCQIMDVSNNIKQKLSYVLQYDEDKLVLNGATQVYPILRNIFKNKNALIPSPTFGEYEETFEKYNTYYDNGEFDIIEIESKMESADVVVFVNPNNPTGSILSSDWLLDISLKFPEKIIIIDESFIEFSKENSIIELLENKKLTNVIVIRSMSKNYGLPGLRLDLFTHNEILYKQILSNIPIWNLNSIAEFYLEIILKNKLSLLESFEKTKYDRDILITNLKKISYIDKVFQSEANFILFRIDIGNFKADELIDYLLNNYNIFIKDITSKFKNDKKLYFRIAVREPDENNLLISALQNFPTK